MQCDGPTGTRDRADNVSDTPARNASNEAVCDTLITNVKTHAKRNVDSDTTMPSLANRVAHSAPSAKPIKKDSRRIGVRSTP